MNQNSAVNNAKTRGGKARALKAHTGQRLIMESVTIPRRAPKRKRAAEKTVEPVHPPIPDNEQSIPAAGTVAGGDAELRDGWNLIQQYFDDKVGAPAVSDYIDTVKDAVRKAELDRGFSAAMDCEDSPGRKAVAAMIVEKLKFFGKFSSN
jgi:hypothetical protein